MEKKKFEKLVQEAVLSLPQKIRKKMENISIVVEDGPQKNLLGLYEGVPKNTWGRNFFSRLPDKITIFKESIENFARSEEEIHPVKSSEGGISSKTKLFNRVKKLIRKVVWHEVAHHFGYDEAGVRKIEAKKIF